MEKYSTNGQKVGWKRGPSIFKSCETEIDLRAISKQRTVWPEVLLGVISQFQFSGNF